METEIKCPWCSYRASTLNGISAHVKRHNKGFKETYDALYPDKANHICACGKCGRTTKFKGLLLGYSEYLRGHSQRVKNNFHARGEESHKKISETRKQRIASGEIGPVWNKGETKETDPRVAAYSLKQAEMWSENDEKKARYAERIRESWRTGAIVPLRGPAHSQWKGGISSVNNLAHSLLYNAWSFPKMMAANFTCSTCGDTRDLCVHHDRERFSDLLREAASDVGFDGVVDRDNYEAKARVAQRMVDIHLDRDISGIVLCRECHARVHEAIGEKKEAAVIRSRALSDQRETRPH